MRGDYRGYLTGRRGLVLACVIIVVINLPGLVYVTGVPLEDDPDTPIILANVREDMSARGLLRWFARDWPLENGLYRPLVAISLAADSAIFGDYARGYRAVNWGMAVLTALGLFFWAKELGISTLGALLAAAFFSLQQSVRQPRLPTWAVLVTGATILVMILVRRVRQQRGRESTDLRAFPIVGAAAALYMVVLHWMPLTTVVSWIAARTALMCTLLATWAMVAVTRYTRCGGHGWLATGFALTALALCSYEQALMVPFAFLLLPLLARGASFRRGFIAAAFILLLIPTYCAVRLATVGSEASQYVMLARKSTLQGSALSLAAYVVRPYRVVEGLSIRLGTAFNLVDPLMWWSVIVLAIFVAVFWRLFATVPRSAGIMLAMQTVLFLPMAGLHIFAHYYYLPGIAAAVLASSLLHPQGLSALEAGIRPAGDSTLADRETFDVESEPQS